jgi:hypothetical protein
MAAAKNAAEESQRGEHQASRNRETFNRTGGVIMKRAMWSLALVVFAVVGIAATSMAAYPDKPIQLIVPYSAGGSTDVLARAIGQVAPRFFPHRRGREQAGGEILAADAAVGGRLHAAAGAGATDWCALTLPPYISRFRDRLRSRSPCSVVRQLPSRRCPIWSSGPSE